MLTASIAEFHPSMERSYSLPMNRQESSEGVLNRSFSPNNGVGRSDGSTERLRNRTNLQLNLRSKMEDRDSIAEEPHRVKSPPGEAQLTKVAESRSKERRMEGEELVSGNLTESLAVVYSVLHEDYLRHEVLLYVFILIIIVTIIVS